MNVEALYVVVAMIAVTGFTGLGALVLLQRRDERELKRELERIRRR